MSARPSHWGERCPILEIFMVVRGDSVPPSTESSIAPCEFAVNWNPSIVLENQVGDLDGLDPACCSRVELQCSSEARFLLPDLSLSIDRPSLHKINVFMITIIVIETEYSLTICKTMQLGKGFNILRAQNVNLPGAFDHPNHVKWQCSIETHLYTIPGA
jgi:hypothetical protein